MTAFAGQCIIEELFLYDANNKEYDLRYIVGGIELYEDVYSQFITGTITIADKLDLISNIPLLGEEKIKLKISTVDMKNDSIQGWFAVYKIGDLSITEANPAITYTLHFISADALNDINTRVSRAMAGRIDELARNVFTKYLKTAENKVLALEQTKNTIKFIPGFWSPSEILMYLQERAISTNGNKTYLSFETNKRYVFGAISTLISAKEFSKYGFFKNTRDDLPNGSLKNLETEFSQIISASVDTVTDYMTRNVAGGLAGKLLTHNLLTKTIKTVDYDLIKKWNPGQHLNANLNTKSNSYRNRTAQINFATNIHYSYDDQVSDWTQSVMLERRALLNHLNSTMLDVEVYGRTDIEVGKVVYLEFPKFAPIHNNDPTNKLKSNYYSGRYLITAIAHRFTGKGKHTMNMQCVKDSFEKAQ